MQTIETQINKLDSVINQINTVMQEHAPDCKILELIEDEDKDEDDCDYDSDDSDISFTEEERELIESEEHYAFLRRYSLKPTAETPFFPEK